MFIKRFLTGFGIVGAVLWILLMVFLGGICLHYDVVFWTNFLHYPMHGSPALFWIVCLIAGFFVGWLSIPVAVITLVLSFFI